MQDWNVVSQRDLHECIRDGLCDEGGVCSRPLQEYAEGGNRIYPSLCRCEFHSQRHLKGARHAVHRDLGGRTNGQQLLLKMGDQPVDEGWVVEACNNGYPPRGGAADRSGRQVAGHGGMVKERAA